MLVFTAMDDSKITIQSQDVVRVRRAMASDNPQAKTRIDWGMISLVKDELQDVVSIVSEALPSLLEVSVGRSGFGYFNAKKIPAVLPPIPRMEEYGYKSSFKILGYRQHTRHEISELRAMIDSVT